MDGYKRILLNLTIYRIVYNKYCKYCSTNKTETQEYKKQIDVVSS